MTHVSQDWGQDPAVWSGRADLCLQCWGEGGNQRDSIPQGDFPTLFQSASQSTICRTACRSLAGTWCSRRTQLAGLKPTRVDSPAVITRTYSWTGRPFFSPETFLKLWNCKIKIFEQGPNSTRGAAHLPHEVPLLFPGSCYALNRGV